MEIFRLENFTKGWVIGDFEPNIIKTKEFEFAIHPHKNGEKGEVHVHRIAEEVTVIISGSFEMNNKIVNPGDIIQLKPGEAMGFHCLADAVIAVIKIPSVIGDKYAVK
ncbi:MAG: hypothetical protein ABIG60_02615 [Patescibacteria group bacterium]